MNSILITGDATRRRLESNSVDLIITHLPYFGTDVFRYGGNPEKQINARSSKAMIKMVRKAVKEMYRVLKPTGSLIIANGERDLVGLRIAVDIFDNTSFIYQGKIITNSYGPDSEKHERVCDDNLITWNHFSKTSVPYVNPFEVRKYNNPVWNFHINNDIDEIDIELSKKYFVGDTLNIDFAKRVISMFTKKGHVVLDPFGGTGTVASAAIQLGRFGISNDISQSQTDIAKERLSLTFDKH